MAGFNILPITEIIDPGNPIPNSDESEWSDSKPEWEYDTDGMVECLTVKSIGEIDIYTRAVVCDYDISGYENPVWEETLSGVIPYLQYAGWVYLNVTVTPLPDVSYCLLTVVKRYIHIRYELIVEVVQPTDEYTECDCYGEDGYWDKTIDSIGEEDTYIEYDSRKYCSGELSIYPEIRVSGELCPIKSLGRDGWVITSLDVVYQDPPSYAISHIYVTRHYIQERLYCTFCPDEDIEFPENDPLYEYSKVWYEWEEAIDCGYGQREEAYINCNQMYRCKWKPGWEWVPEDPSNPDNPGGAWVPDEVPPPGPWVPDDGGDGEDFPGVGTPLDDYTSCCDFVPKDFIAWADGWNLSVLDEPK